MKKETMIDNYLNSLLRTDNRILDFVETLSKIGEIIFFGGSIRDLYLANEHQNSPRDYDVVINLNRNITEFENFLESYEYRKNRFDGYKIIVGDTEFDIWRIEKTWAFNNKLLENEERNLIESVYLSVDGIAYNYNKKILYDNILKDTDDRKEINIVLKNNPQKELNLLRGLIFKEKYNYNLSYELKSEYRDFKRMNKNLSKILYDLQYDHYKEEKLTLEQIEKELRMI